MVHLGNSIRAEVGLRLNSGRQCYSGGFFTQCRSCFRCLLQHNFLRLLRTSQSCMILAIFAKGQLQHYKKLILLLYIEERNSAPSLTLTKNTLLCRPTGMKAFLVGFIALFMGSFFQAVSLAFQLILIVLRGHTPNILLQEANIVVIITTIMLVTRIKHIADVFR